MAFSRDRHPDERVDQLVTKLLDALAQWERATNISSVFILREGDVVIRAMDGKPNIPEDLSDADLFDSSAAFNAAPM